MLIRYQATYHDRFGEERTFIENDGHSLRMSVRGVEFISDDFGDFEPRIAADDPRLNSFTILMQESYLNNSPCLIACTIQCDIPLTIVDSMGAAGKVVLKVTRRLPCEDDKCRFGSLEFEMLVGDKALKGGSTHFEDGMLLLNKQLPQGSYIKACITCALSDYNPAGQSPYGSLGCFRGNKEAYRAVMSKDDLFRIWSTMTECVQETYLCPEYERRKSGTGYRG